jgi:hypothetical protein
MKDDEKTPALDVLDLSVNTVAARAYVAMVRAWRRRRIAMIVAENLREMRIEYVVRDTENGWECRFRSGL